MSDFIDEKVVLRAAVKKAKGTTRPANSKGHSMPIEAICEQCFQSYSVEDNRAGKTFKCKECGSAVRVPQSSGRNRVKSNEVAEEDDSGPAALRRQPRPGAARPASSQKKSKQSESSPGLPMTLLLSIGGGAVSLIAVIVVCLVVFGRSGGDANPTVASGDSSSKSVDVSAASSAAGPIGKAEVFEVRTIDALLPLSLAAPDGTTTFRPGDAGRLAVTMLHPDGHHLLVRMKLTPGDSLPATLTAVLDAAGEKSEGLWLVQPIDQTTAQWQLGQPANLRQVVPAGVLQTGDADAFTAVCPISLAQKMKYPPLTSYSDDGIIVGGSQAGAFGEESFGLHSRRTARLNRDDLVHIRCQRETQYGPLTLYGSVDFSWFGDPLFDSSPPPEIVAKFTLQQATSANLVIPNPIAVGQDFFTGKLQISQNNQGEQLPLVGETRLVTPRGFSVFTDFGKSMVSWSPASSPGWWAVSAPAPQLVRQPDGVIEARLLFARPRDLSQLSVSVAGGAPITIKVAEATASPASLPLLTIKTDKVQALALNRDGTQLLSAHENGQIRLWDTSSGQEIKTLTGHTDAVVSVAFAPDGQRAVSGSLDKTARVWELSTGKELTQFSSSRDLINCVAFLADGQQVLSGGTERTLRLRNVSDGVEQRVFVGHLQTVSTLSLLPGEVRVLTGSFDQSLGLWDLATGMEILPPLLGHTREIVSVACASDGQRALSTSLDHTARIWDLSSGQTLHVLRGHTDAVKCGAFLQEGRQIVTASFDRTVRVWDAATGAQQQLFRGHLTKVSAVVAAPSGMVFSADFDGVIHRWNPQDLPAVSPVAAEATPAVATLPDGAIRELPGHVGGIDGFAILPDGNRIVTAGRDEAIVVRDLNTGRVIVRHRAPQFAANHEHRELLYAGEPDYRFCGLVTASRRQGKVERVVTAAGIGTKVRLCVLTLEDAPAVNSDTSHSVVTAVEFQPEVRPLFVTIDPNDKFVTGVSPEERLRQAQGQVDFYHIYYLALSPDGRWLTVAHSLGSVDIFDLEGDLSKGKPAYWFAKGELDGSAMTHRPLFLANGDLLLGGERRTSPKWEFAGKIDQQAPCFGHVLFDPKEKWFLRADREQLEYLAYDAKTGRVDVRELKGHAVAIRALAISSDSRQVASSDAAGTVIVWHLPALTEARRFQLGSVDVPQIAFVGDGKQLLTADSAGRLLLWDLPPIPKGNAKPATKKTKP